MRVAKSKVIFLKKIKYGEADLIVTALTQQGEKLSLIARSALKSKKRFSGGALEPTTFAEIQYKVPVQNENLRILEDSHVIQGFDGLRESYDRLDVAFMMLSSIEKVAHESPSSVGAELFNLLGNSLKALEKASDLDVLRVQFVLKFLRIEGVLSLEDWMKPFVSQSVLVELNEDFHRQNHRAAREHWPRLEFQLREYLQNAERTHF